MLQKKGKISLILFLITVIVMTITVISLGVYNSENKENDKSIEDDSYQEEATTSNSNENISTGTENYSVPEKNIETGKADNIKKEQTSSEQPVTEEKPDERLENRALLIVIENNFNISDEIQTEYEKYKFLADIFIADMLGIKRSDLEDKTLLEIVDVYLEDYLAKNFKAAAKDYGEVIVLTDEKASYNNFKEKLLELNSEGKIIDILLHLHGSSNSIYFYNESVLKSSIVNDKELNLSQKPLNLGYLYQTVCYGRENLQIWTDLGAKVASGAVGVNKFVIFAPEQFIKLWVSGKTYSDAVNESINFEISSWKSYSIFLPESITSFLFGSEEDMKEGTMQFTGDKNYSLPK